VAKVTVVATQAFAHGAINAAPGDELVIEESLARDLAHFVRVKDTKMRPVPRNKMQPDSLEPAPGEVQAGGVVRPSSSLPAAPVSPARMSNKSVVGAKKPGRPAKKSGASLR